MYKTVVHVIPYKLLLQLKFINIHKNKNMKNLILILLLAVSFVGYSQIKTSKKNLSEKTMAMKNGDSKDFIAGKIKIEWENNGTKNARVIRKDLYKDCDDFYTLTSLDKDKVKCTDMGINLKVCDVSNGSLENIGDCETVKCPACTTCAEARDLVATAGGVAISCWKTETGIEMEVVVLQKVKRMQRRENPNMKLNKN